MARHAAALRSSSAPRAPIADQLVEVATRIIVRDGYSALTVHAIEREAGVSRSLIHYHFGGKTGLLLAVIDTVFKDLGPPEATPSPDDAAALLAAELESDRALSADGEKMLLFFELLPHILRDDELRERLQLFYRRGGADASPGDDGGRTEEDRRHAAHQEHHRRVQRALTEEYGAEPAAAVSGLMAAVLDGLGLQVLVDPAGVDHAQRYRTWQDMVFTYLESRRTTHRT